MSTPEEESQNTVSSSRDSSFFSLTSGNSIYFSAKDMLSQEENGGGENGSRSNVQVASVLGNSDDKDGDDGDGCLSGGGSGTFSNSSSTLEEAESIGSFSDAPEFDSSVSNGNGMNGSNIKRSPSSSSVEVRKGISRLCSTIANTDSVDVTKKNEIEGALASKDVHTLRKLAVGKGGLLSNALREHAWTLLIGISPKELAKGRGGSFTMEYPDVSQQIQNLVKLDVARVLKRFPPGLSDPQQDHLQSVLSNLICAVLQRNPQAHYYQGFHDISLTFLLVASVQNNPYLAYLCLNKMIEVNLGPHMERTMDSTHELIHTIYAIIEKEDKALFRKIVVDTKCPVAFCLPWVLTWFSHTLPDDSDVFRLYDYMLGSQAKVDPPHLIPIFVSAALVLKQSKKLLQDQSLTDIASMHQALAKLPSELTSLEPWMEDSTKLMTKYKGQESSLIHRGRKIKEMQQNLWNDESNNNRRSPARRDNLFIYTSRLLFVRYRWTTLSLVVMLAAAFLQTRYGRSMFQVELFRNAFDTYTPRHMRRLFNFASEDEGRG